jgi:hypothetical protein
MIAEQRIGVRARIAPARTSRVPAVSRGARSPDGRPSGDGSILAPETRNGARG